MVQRAVLLKDGRAVYVYCEEVFSDLVEEYMGEDAALYINSVIQELNYFREREEFDQ